METYTITLQENVQNPTIRRKTDAYTVLGLARPNTGTVSGESTKTNSARYSEMLTDRLKPAIRRKRLGLLSKNAAHIAETLRKLV